MSILTIYTEQVSVELQSFLQDIKPNVDNYYAAKDVAQKERMIIIGKVAEYKEQFPQRSTDHRVLSQAMNKEWSSDVIDNNKAAYKEYKRLMETDVEDYKELAQASNPTQLMTLSRGTGTTLAFDAVKHLKKTGSVPSVGKLKQHIQGRISPTFESRTVSIRNSDETSSVPDTELKTTTPYVAPTPLTPDEQTLQRKGLLDRKDFIYSLVNNENLPLIDTVSKGCLWALIQGGDMEDVIKQLLDKNPSMRKSIAEHLNNDTQDNLTIDITVEEPKPAVWDNRVENGVRWRR